MLQCIWMHKTANKGRAGLWQLARARWDVIKAHEEGSRWNPMRRRRSAPDSESIDPIGVPLNLVQRGLVTQHHDNRGRRGNASRWGCSPVRHEPGGQSMRGST